MELSHPDFVKLTANGEAPHGKVIQGLLPISERTEAFSPIAHKELSLANNHMSLEVGASQMRSSPSNVTAATCEQMTKFSQAWFPDTQNL